MLNTTGKSTLWIWAGLLFAATFAVFYPATGYDFVGIDDPGFVSSNPHVLAGLTPDGVAWAFKLGEGDYWHPLVWLSFMLDVSLFGTSAHGLHLTNVLLHAANAALLFWALATWTNAPGRSAMVAALFALHPLRVESVAWITERKDVLSTFFWFLALIAYGHYVRASETGDRRSKIQNPKSKIQNRRVDIRTLASGPYWLTLLFFVLGLMSKPMVLTLPFTMLLADCWPFQRVDPFAWRQQRATVWRLIREKLPFFALAIASALLTFWGQNHAAETINVVQPVIFPLSMRLENALVAYATYLFKTFWPTGLVVVYPHPGSWSPAILIGAALLVTGFAVMSLWLARRHRYTLVGWLWFMGTLVPVIGLLKGWIQYLADRFTYVPCVGLFIIVVWGATELCRHWRLPRNFLIGAGVAALIACSILTRQQLGYWSNTETLFRHAIDLDENNWVAHTTLALDLKRKGRFDEALEHYQTAFRLEPDYEDTLNNYGALLLTLGRLDEAIDKFEAATRIDPKNPSPHNNLGVAFYRQGRLEDAIAQIQHAIALNPEDSQARSNLVALIEERVATTNAVPPP